MSADTASELQTIPANDELPDFNDPSFYLNRELTWLEFNRRVLHESNDARNPLLERLKFLAIVSGNLDEFFMKRIGGLKQQVGAGMSMQTVDGRSPKQQITDSYKVVAELINEKTRYLEGILSGLKEHGIQILHYEDLDKAEKSYLRDYYYDNIFPLVTPQSIDPAHPFPFISNLSLNLLVIVKYPEQDKTAMTRVKVPVGTGIPRFLQLPGRNAFVPLEEVMEHNLEMLLPGMEVISCDKFRVTRNANTERNEEHADDLLSLIESELRDRKFAPIVRLEVESTMDTVNRGMLAAELHLNEDEDVFELSECMMATRDLFEIVSLDIPELHDEPHYAIDNVDLMDTKNIFHAIRERGPFLLQHPYESFVTSVERFLKEASIDPKVRAIKMTLYRTSGDTKVLDYLISASRNGKQVAVVVELKARFDEAANIRWAARMEEAGIHVTYGVIGLKTHSKIILVVRNDYNGLRRYLHIGTGNYHAGTARLYSDLGLLTSDEILGQDATELFNYLTTGYQLRTYQKLLTSPKALKKSLMQKIDRERKLALEGKKALIQFKMNALEDVDITRGLYEAARDGVHIDLIIRDTCRLRPGIPGVSENVRVIGIVGRFLEHTRIYYFHNDGQEEYFIGSADSMKRNLESRVEVVTPVEGETQRGYLREILDTQLNDRRSAWEMQTDGSYIQYQPETEEQAVGSQQQMILLAQSRLRKAKKASKAAKTKNKYRPKSRNWNV